MILHLLKLIWNRRRANALIVLEIFLSFIVIFAVATAGLYFLDSYRKPLGFAYEGAWHVAIDTQQDADSRWTQETRETFVRLLEDLEGWRRLEAAAVATAVPYHPGTQETTLASGDRTLLVEIGQATEGFRDALDLQLVSGRWFEEADEAMSWQPAVIDLELAEQIFGDEDPVGKTLESPGGRRQMRVIGVVTDYRKGGEFSTPKNFLFERFRRQDPKASLAAPSLVLRVPPGTSAEFEEELVDRMQAIGRSWSFKVTPLDQMRRSSFRLHLAPLLAAGVVAVFLLLMVALGLTGVLWQTVTRRRPEIGLRRAIGASSDAVRRQILLELLLLATISAALGLLVVVQIPLLGLASFLSLGTFLSGLLASLVIIYLLALLCGYYPSWMATRIYPADALRSD